MDMLPELPQPLHREISRLSALGDTLADEKKFPEAIAEYLKAWELLPPPKETWTAAGWLLAAIGEAHFFQGNYENARQTFLQAIVRTGGLGNPFLHLRHGQALFECGEIRQAADELMRAYMGGGPELFAAEDPKYLRHLATVAIL